MNAELFTTLGAKTLVKVPSWEPKCMSQQSHIGESESIENSCLGLCVVFYSTMGHTWLKSGSISIFVILCLSRTRYFK